MSSKGADESAADSGNGFEARVSVIRIKIEPNAWTALRGNPRNYVRCNISEGTNHFRNVAVRSKGNSGSSQPLELKPSLTLNFDEFEQGQLFYGMDKIHLNNSSQDPTFVREFLASEIFRRSGLAAPHVGYARVELNGRDLGLYVVVEGYNRRFVAQHFAQATGTLFDAENRHDLQHGLRVKADSGQSAQAAGLALRSLGDAANILDHRRRMGELAKLIDLDKFSQYLAIEIMANSADGYVMQHNNYWLFRDAREGKFHFLGKGMDQIFLEPESSMLPNARGLVAAAVLCAPAGRRQFRAAAAAMLTNAFEEAFLTNTVARARARVLPEMGNWGQVSTFNK